MVRRFWLLLASVSLLAASGCESERTPPAAKPKPEIPIVKAKLRDPYAATTKEAIDRFEIEIGHKLPDDYREFLLRNNGGSFHDDVSSNGFGVDVVFGLNTGYSWSDLKRTRNTSLDWIPDTMLPISSGAGGDYALLKLAEPNRGAVYAQYHDDDDPPNKIANSFTEFLKECILDPEALASEIDPDPAFQAINLDDAAALGKLLDDGLDIEHANADGKTLLMHATWKCRLELVELLLDRGAKLHARDKRGHTLIFYSVYPDSPSCLLLLASCGGKFDEPNNKGRTPLSIAVEYGYVRAVATLLELGANPNHRTPDGKSILSFCYNSSDVIRPLLLKAGANE